MSPFTGARALKELVKLVEAGLEYPEAHTRTVISLELSDAEAAQLTAAYDAQWEYSA